MKNRPLVIGITAGDPAGIGPEVALKAINNPAELSIIPLLICRESVIKTYYPHFNNNFKIFTGAKDFIFKENEKYLLKVDDPSPIPQIGEGTVDTGRESLAYIDTAIELWQNGIIDAIVTGPVNKGFIEKSGTPFIGHTEYIAEKTGKDNPYMMMYSKEYRVLLASTHLPLSGIPDYVTEQRLLDVIEMGYNSITSIDGDNINIAIAGMDPHCGDDGAIGAFDKNITIPAVKKAQQKGIPIVGPFAADTLFMKDTWKNYNLVIAQYHDQGLIPFKMIAFEKGVNITLGLPVTRTSVDHGTAYNIAGKDIASHESMVEAIHVASLLEKIRKK